MSESKYLEDLPQHPLYQAAEKCIDRETRDTYNYHDFSPRGMDEWWIKKQSSRSYSELMNPD